jgi:hypothetical protein
VDGKVVRGLKVSQVLRFLAILVTSGNLETFSFETCIQGPGTLPGAVPGGLSFARFRRIIYLRTVV